MSTKYISLQTAVQKNQAQHEKPNKAHEMEEDKEEEGEEKNAEGIPFLLSDALAARTEYSKPKKKKRGMQSILSFIKRKRGSYSD